MPLPHSKTAENTGIVTSFHLFFNKKSSFFLNLSIV